MEHYYSISYQTQPNRMFQGIIVMFKGAAGIVGRVYVDTFYLAGKFLFQGFEGEEIVAEDETVVEDVFFAGTVLGVAAFGGVFQQDARFKAGAVFLADPG
jgi:hypothetical protein